MEKYEEGVLSSQVDATKDKRFAFIGLLAWVLVLLAIFACLWRNDCNVLMGLLMILILNRQFNSNPALYSKIIIHLLLVLIIIDLVWMFIMFPYWNDEKNEEIYTGAANALHTWVEIIGVLELLVKGGMLFFLITFYKNLGGSFKGLLNLKYS